MLQCGVPLPVCGDVVGVEKVLVVAHAVVPVLVQRPQHLLQALLDAVGLRRRERTLKYISHLHHKYIALHTVVYIGGGVNFNPSPS